MAYSTPVEQIARHLEAEGCFQDGSENDLLTAAAEIVGKHVLLHSMFFHRDERDGLCRQGTVDRIEDLLIYFRTTTTMQTVDNLTIEFLESGRPQSWIAAGYFSSGSEEGIQHCIERQSGEADERMVEMMRLHSGEIHMMWPGLRQCRSHGRGEDVVAAAKSTYDWLWSNPEISRINGMRRFFDLLPIDIWPSLTPREGAR